MMKTKDITTKLGLQSGSGINYNKLNSEVNYNENLYSKPLYFKEINKANSEQMQRIYEVAERELKWLDSNEYISRKKEATGMPENTIRKYAQRIKEQLGKTTINVLEEKANLASGVYEQDKKNPTINIFKTGDEALTLNVIDHEIKHAVSEQALETMDDLIRVFTSNYNKYPKINNKKIGDYIPVVETSGKWASNAPEQQVISKRIMDVMEYDYGFKRGTKLTINDLERLTIDLNNQIKRGDRKNHDMITMLYKIKQKHKDSYKQKVCEMVNSAY